MMFLKASAASSFLCLASLTGAALLSGYIPIDINVPQNERMLPNWLIFLVPFVAAYFALLAATYIFSRVAYVLKILSLRFLILCAVIASALLGFVLGYSPPVISSTGITALLLFIIPALLILLPAVFLWWKVANGKPSKGNNSSDGA